MTDHPTDKSPEEIEAKKPETELGIDTDTPEIDKPHYRMLRDAAMSGHAVSLGNYKDLAEALRRRNTNRDTKGHSL